MPQSKPEPEPEPNKDTHPFISSISKNKELIFLFIIMASLFIVLIYNQDLKNIDQVKTAVVNITDRFDVLENHTEQRELQDRLNSIDVINALFMLLLDNKLDLNKIIAVHNISTNHYVELNKTHIVAVNLLPNNSIITFEVPFPINLTNIEELNNRNNIK